MLPRKDQLVGDARRHTARLLTRASRVRVLRPLTAIGMRIVFDGAAPVWDQVRSHERFLAALDAALDAAGAAESPPGRVLDVACGTGLATRHLASRFPDADVHGVDISPRMVALAGENVPAATFATCDATRLPDADASIDLVVSLDGVFDEHELARVLAPGGRLVIVYSGGAGTPVARDPHQLSSALESAGLVVTADLGDAPWIIHATRS